MPKSKLDINREELGARLKLLAETLCRTKTEFAKSLGETPQSLQSWIARGTSRKNLDYILLVHPQVRREWLYHGEGEMLQGVPVSAPQQEEPASSLEAITNLTQVVLLQQQKIKELEAEIARLKAKE